MKRITLILKWWALIFSSAIIFSGCDSSDNKGACVTRIGCTKTTSLICEELGGDFYKGKSCSDFGYNSAEFECEECNKFRAELLAIRDKSE